eukprot:TRINITY_DN5868_c0_g1_i7.p1 TRINITY_DN5868_c0_g1~~TRINITY_DN5868_c0_g1_i7.p1  ORF type:complete len:293 (-),score=58.51 TRINITY_DN5868_c0_g1_i7:148-1026(-)
MDKIYVGVPQSTKQLHNSRNLMKKLPETYATNSVLFKSIQLEKERLERMSNIPRNYNKNGVCKKTVPERNNLTGKTNKTVKEMTPSRSMKAIESGQEDEIVLTLKRILAEKSTDKKFSLISALFLKLIAADSKYGWALEEIKAAYDHRLLGLTQKSVQHKARVDELARSVQQLKRESKELRHKLALVQLRNNSTKLSRLVTTPKKYSEKAQSPVLELPSKVPMQKTKKGIMIPRLDLSKVKNNFENDKVIYIPAKPRPKNFTMKESHSFYKSSSSTKLNGRMKSAMTSIKVK